MTMNPVAWPVRPASRTRPGGWRGGRRGIDPMKLLGLGLVVASSLVTLAGWVFFFVWLAR